jgi:anti-sigma regulatory factor (Ser/Thr protein kinase)
MRDPDRQALIVSEQAVTCRRLAQALSAAGYGVRVVSLASGETLRGALLVLDLDVDLSASPADLVAQARARFGALPIVAVAGLGVPLRLLCALAEPGVYHVVPKRGASRTADAVAPLPGTCYPEEHAIYSAARRRLAVTRGPGQYLTAGAQVHARHLRASDERIAALEELGRFLRELEIGDERRARVELVAEELLMNALYDAPHDPDGRPRFAALDRRTRVELAPGERATLEFGADGQLLVVSVSDPFGALHKRTVMARMLEAARGTIAPAEGEGGAGLGLVMAYAAASQLAFGIEPGKLTEVTAMFWLSGTNREVQERGTAVHFHGGQAGEE